MQIRKIQESDARAFLHLQKGLDRETAFMLLEPGERKESVAETVQRIREILAADNSTLLLAEDRGELVGYLAAFGGRVRRNGHVVSLVVGIRQAWTGRGIGTRLLEAVEAWARQQGIHRMELTVMTHNERALALYQKAGFQIEGTRRDALRVEDTYVDEYDMSKLLVEERGNVEQNG
ncbi:MAG: GNAT family N-acetyltransferase [Firmicutes bacterium]|nr:GNAT family N-acetyltransferase [Bacillota bacterium]